jgi:peptidoglycan hydrolase-like protein with peptidoglycan-binding domain
MYEQGALGDGPDLAAAAGWYRTAVEGGFEEAREALERTSQAAAVPPALPPSRAAAEPAPQAASQPAAVPPAEAAPPGPVTADTIREIQERLTQLGYDPGPVDGVTGSRTRAAIESYQAARGLSGPAEPSAALLQRLRQDEAN